MKRTKLLFILFALTLLVNLAAVMPTAVSAAVGDFVPVENIIDVPTKATAQSVDKPQTPLELIGAVVPENATYKTIAWSVKDAGKTGATITDGFLNATAGGEVVVTASITGARISAGNSHTMALKADGSLWAWGDNEYGQLGLGDEFKEDYSPTPLRVGDKNNWAAVVAGRWHTIAIKTDGTLWAWGWADYGLLGLGEDFDHLDNDDYGYTYVNKPVQVGTDTNWLAVEAGEWHNIALKTDGSLWAWGDNSICQLGIDGNCLRIEPGDIIETSFEPVRVGLENDWAAISAGEAHNIARKVNGTLWAWGFNAVGQLGIGSNDYQIPTPSQVLTGAGKDYDWAEITAGYSYTMAMKTDGSLWAWGWADYGQLGLGEDYEWLYTEDSWRFKYVNTPVRVGDGNDWLVVEAGDMHAVALKTNGTLWVWGDNSYGQLGIGEDEEGSFIPVQVGEDTDWMVISANISDHTVAMKKDGNLWVWGANWYGQLGVDNDYEYSFIPVKVMFPDGQTAAYARDFTIKAILYGDVNGDGTVNSRDVTALERSFAGWPEEIDEDAADVDGSGTVNSKDVTSLERHLAGWPGYETLPILLSPSPEQAPEMVITPLLMSVAADTFGTESPLLGNSEVTMVGATPLASVKKLNGNKNDLTISVTERFSDGSIKTITETFSINNNTAGSYQVGAYAVYVEIKGNDQVKQCYIMK